MGQQVLEGRGVACLIEYTQHHQRGSSAIDEAVGVGGQLAGGADNAVFGRLDEGIRVGLGA